MHTPKQISITVLAGCGFLKPGSAPVVAILIMTKYDIGIPYVLCFAPKQDLKRSRHSYRKKKRGRVSSSQSCVAGRHHCKAQYLVNRRSNKGTGSLLCVHDVLEQDQYRRLRWNWNKTLVTVASIPNPNDHELGFFQWDLKNY